MHSNRGLLHTDRVTQRDDIEHTGFMAMEIEPNAR